MSGSPDRAVEAGASTSAPANGDDDVTLSCVSSLIFAHLNQHASEAQLFAPPPWAVQMAKLQRQTKRFPIPPRIEEVSIEVRRLCYGTRTDSNVQILALTFFERIIFGRSATEPAHPCMCLLECWAMLWHQCVNLAAKVYYDSRSCLSDLGHDPQVSARLSMADLQMMEMLTLCNALRCATHSVPHNDPLV